MPEFIANVIGHAMCRIEAHKPIITARDASWDLISDTMRQRIGDVHVIIPDVEITVVCSRCGKELASVLVERDTPPDQWLLQQD